MVEFAIGDRTFRTVPLSAFDQLRVARRIWPVLSAVVKASDKKLIAQIKQVKDAKPEAADAVMPSNESIAEIMGVIGEAIEALSEDELDSVIRTCLSVVQMKDGKSWVAIYNKDAQDFQYDFINLPIMLQLAFRVIEDALGDFFPANSLSTSAP